MDEVTTAFSIPALLYEEGSFFVFVLVTIILGGGAGWLTGRAIAETWRPRWQIVLYSLILGFGVRFIHFSVFSGTLLSPHFYVVDTTILMGLALLGFRSARAAQMVTQYPWINETAGPMRWRRRAS